MLEIKIIVQVIVLIAMVVYGIISIAKYLANKYNGLFVDIDTIPSNSIKAKIEAFLRLR